MISRLAVGTNPNAAIRHLSVKFRRSWNPSARRIRSSKPPWRIPVSRRKRCVRSWRTGHQPYNSRCLRNERCMTCLTVWVSTAAGLQNKTSKKIPETDAIFDKLNHVHAIRQPQTLRISLDTKAKVKVGEFSRGGTARGKQAVAAVDHDSDLCALWLALPNWVAGTAGAVETNFRSPPHSPSPA